MITSEDKNSTFSLPYFSAFPHFSGNYVTSPTPLCLNLQSAQILFSNWLMLLNFNFLHLPLKYTIFFSSGLDATFKLRLEFCHHEKQTESDRNRPLDTLLAPYCSGIPWRICPSGFVTRVIAVLYFLLRKVQIHVFH